MKPLPCFKVNKNLENAARQAEQRKNQAIDRLTKKLKPNRFERALVDVIDADKRALQEKGR
jgi:hypothetical protein